MRGERSAVDRQKFLNLERQLFSLHPEVVVDGDKLAGAIVPPDVKNADLVWSVIWEKPLFANTKVAIAQRQIDAVRPLFKGAWRFIGSDHALFHVGKVATGSRTSAFAVTGTVAEEARIVHRIAPHRLLAIQGAAQAVKARAERQREGLFADLNSVPLSVAVTTLQREFGPYWGPITVLHVLTDMGLACKPDLHLVRSVAALGGPIASGKVPSFREAIEINEAVRTLAIAVHGNCSPRQLRRLDLSLMEISRLGFLR